MQGEQSAGAAPLQRSDAMRVGAVPGRCGAGRCGAGRCGAAHATTNEGSTMRIPRGSALLLQSCHSISRSATSPPTVRGSIPSRLSRDGYNPRTENTPVDELNFVRACAVCVLSCMRRQLRSNFECTVWRTPNPKPTVLGPKLCESITPHPNPYQ
jgi:hypothetical protein